MSDSATLEQQADRAAAAGQFAVARSLLEDAVKVDTSSAALWTKLSAMRKASGDLRGALAALDQSLAISPLDFSSLLYRAVILDALGDPGAGQEFGHALAQAPSDDDLPEPMKPAVAHARMKWEAFKVGREARLLDVLPDSLTKFQRQKAERFITNYSRRTRAYHQEPSDFHYPGLPEVEFHDREQFAELDAIEHETDAIKAEFEALVAAEAAEMVPYVQYPDRIPLRQWKELNNNPQWTAIHLLQRGKRVDTNARHCPRTMEALAKLSQPVVVGASPNAMFSLLAPQTRIPPHTGVANTRLVCHLPLVVPPKCGFRVGETVREWKVGEAFVFDDTIEHEAWNDSDELRVVLIFDLWPPALSAAERTAVAAVIRSSGVSFSGA